MHVLIESCWALAILIRFMGIVFFFPLNNTIILLLDVKGLPCTSYPFHFGLQQVSTHAKSRRRYLLPSQKLNLEDHATSNIHLLGQSQCWASES
jgi:hypothetical protein